MSSGMFRGKESSNRIELSRLVQDLLNFGVFGSLWLWGWVDGGGGWLGGAPHTCAHACTCTHVHAHTRVHGKHDNFMQMAASIGFLGNPWEFPMISYVRIHACVCMHACVCACLWGHPLTTFHPHPPTSHPPGRGNLGITQNSIVLEQIEIFQFCLKI